MKKIIIIALIAFGFTTINAQEVAKKKVHSRFRAMLKRITVMILEIQTIIFALDLCTIITNIMK